MVVTILSIITRICYDLRLAKYRTKPLFDADWYRKMYPDVRVRRVDPYTDYIKTGRDNGRRPSALVTGKSFQSTRLGMRRSFVAPRPPTFWTAFLLDYQRKIIDESGLLDRDWYAGTYGVSVKDALVHFTERGNFAGFDPNPFFSTADYYDANPDIADSGVIAIFHYIESGLLESRPIAPTGKLDRLELNEDAWRFGILMRQPDGGAAGVQMTPSDRGLSVGS